MKRFIEQSANNSNNNSSHHSTTFTLTVFLLSIAWFRSRLRNRIANGEDDDDYDEGNHKRRIENDTISPRGASALQKTKTTSSSSTTTTASSTTSYSYWEGFMECLQNPCESHHNPTGYIALCLAENKLVQEALAIRLMQQGTAITAFSDSVAYCYNGFLGLPSARSAAATFLEKRFWKRGCFDLHSSNGIGSGIRSGIRSGNGNGNELSLEEQKQEEAQGATINGEGDVQANHTTQGSESLSSSSSSSINPDHVAFGSGVGSLLNHIFFIVAQKGDVVLIPAPYYSAFEYHAKATAGCVPFPVYMDNPIHGPMEGDLENAFQLAKKRGKRVKMLLLTNPNDPLGVIYKPSVVMNAILWARRKNIHTIVDEIFALTVHSHESGNRFHSVIEILDNKLENDVHFLWSFSKDFGASGFRLAILYTQNVRLLQALANLNIFSGVSNPMQLIAAEIMSDDEFIDAFLEDAQSQLRWSYKLCTSKLEEMVVPYIPAEAGLFVYVDFSSFLPERTFEGEEKFAALVQDVARVVMTPGQSQRDCKPGMFRLCYAWVTSDVLEIAMERLSFLVLQIRRHSWDDLIAASWRDEVIKCGTHLSTRRSTINLSELSRSSYH